MQTLNSYIHNCYQEYLSKYSNLVCCRYFNIANKINFSSIVSIPHGHFYIVLTGADWIPIKGTNLDLQSGVHQRRDPGSVWKIIFWNRSILAKFLYCVRRFVRLFFGAYYGSPVFLADPTQTYTFITVGTDSEMFSQNDDKKVYG